MWSAFSKKATKARQAQSRVKMIQKLRVLEEDLNIEKEEETIRFNLPTPPICGKVNLEVNGLSIGYSTEIAKNISFLLEKGHKVAVIGSNGIGKSTLLKTVIGHIPPLAGEVIWGHNIKPAYFAQNHLEELNGDETILQSLLGSNHEIGEKGARNLLGSFLFRGEDVHKRISVLSGGEKGRIALARILVQHANLLLLDEPTNHLDMTSVQTLIEAILSYKGSVLFVSHDREFIDAIASHILVMLKDGRSMIFEGKLADYERHAPLCDFPNLFSAEPEGKLSSPDNIDDSPDSSKITLSHDRNLAKELKKERSALEKKIINLELEQTSLRKEIEKLIHNLTTTDSANYESLNQINDELKESEKKLTVSEENWLEYTERFEKIANQLKELGRK